MAVAVIPRRTLDIAGPLGSVIAMKQREKEIDKTLALERRRLRLAETQAAAEERRAEAKERREEKAFDPMLEYQAAQTRYLDAMSKNLADKELQQAQLDLENRRVMLGEKAYKAEKKRIKSLQEGMRSSDPLTAELARNTYWGAKTSQQMGDIIDSLRLQLQMTQAQHNAMMDQAKLTIDKQNSLLTGFKFATEYGPVLEKKIGKDAFKAGYEAMSEMLGFTGAPGGEKKAVGSSKALSAPGIGSAGVVAPPPQMTLDQAINAVRSGTISTEDLLNAWPSLGEIIDRSLLEAAPSNTAISPEVKTKMEEMGSFENHLIRRLQK